MFTSSRSPSFIQRGGVRPAPEPSGEPVQPSVSVGLASLRVGENAESLFERADAALYAAKRAGRNCVCGAD